VPCQVTAVGKITMLLCSGSKSPTSPVTLLGLLDPESGALPSLRTSVTMRIMTQLLIPSEHQ